ncbi:mechanosensitive ion channel family protein [Dyella sp. A6]|uniref:mechanosensitive ion channel family protein n=1 Tax=Dyella aluminiiresistens TaxID=3069105 RepID=UPI002E795EBD|nr:mechanosensitive ion channel domain-containing protein [Dyella sp. A6]
MNALHDLLRNPGMPTLVGVLVLLAAAWGLGVTSRYVLLRVARTVTRRTEWKWDDALFDHGVFRWLAWMVPAVVVQFGIRLVPGISPDRQRMVDNVMMALMVFFLVMALSAALSAVEDLYRRTPHGSRRSLKGLVQLIKLVLFIVAGLVIVVEITGQQVGLLLSGIGAMSAVLLLIFKDTILGFVAGVQLASNDMLRVGDWITVPGAAADGEVIDITLYTVKVRNFDNTIVTVPTWKLISESYQNWRGMTESGGRRIKRALHLDAASVRFLDEGDIERLGRLRLLHDYVATKSEEVARWNDNLGSANSVQANRRRLTNLGTFRAYAQAYLKASPDIHPRMSCMVRQLDSSPQGIPLELYCFTATTVWPEYERIQADIFEHLFAVLPEFGLRLYQQPSGHDVQQGLARFGAGRAESPSPHLSGS